MTPSVVKEAVELKFAREPFGRRSKRKAIKATLKPPSSSIASFNLDRTLRIPGTNAGPFPTMPVHKAFKFPYLMDPKDLHFFCILEQEKRLVRDMVVLGNGLEGSLAKTIVHLQTSIQTAPNHLMPNLPSVKANKRKEPIVYHKSNPQHFPMHNLLETTYIWAKELSRKNRAKLFSFSIT